MVSPAPRPPSAESPAGPVVSVKDVTHRYGKVVALDGISIDIPRGLMVGLVGPDGVGKSTLMGLIAGSRKLQQGKVIVLDGDMRDARHRRTVGPRIAYMPQGLGKNLYPELSVHDNVDFMARLFGLGPSQRRDRVKELLDATGLGPFADRPAGKLSGGMKQKVGLCGALVHDPDLLILDEPTTGVDPLSRRQFWKLIDDIRARRSGMSVVVSTAYMEEAEKWDFVVAMDAGRVLATGTPAELMARTGTKDLDSAFIALLPEEKRSGHVELKVPPRPPGKSEIAIEAHGLTRRFGSFTAVDHVTLSIERGEIFGFLGSNGCGKSTTMKMLTGLLPPTEGTAKLFGSPVEAGSMEVRKNLGYMTQAFSLYGELTVHQNLALHTRLYHLPEEKAKTRMAELVERFGLGTHLDALAGDLPMGLRQRLSLAVAILHEPQMLILDEPTSGVDPVARDQFWEVLVDLSRKDGVTIFVSTHFMNEGMRCDRISLMNAGKVLACDAPQKLIEARGAATLEEAFIAYMEDATAAAPGGRSEEKAPVGTGTEEKPAGPAPSTPSPFRQQLGRVEAYARNETMQILRDPVRLVFALLGPALLMLVFGFGISTDVEHIRYASFDLDRSPESRAYLEQFAGVPRYFTPRSPVLSDKEALKRLQSDDVSVVLEIPPNFGRDLRRGSGPEVIAQVDGANDFRGSTIAQYVQGVHYVTLLDPESGLPAPSGVPTTTTANGVSAARGPPTGSELATAHELPTLSREYEAGIQERYMYNPTFESIYSIVPLVPTILLLVFPAILMTISIVREKELGSIINFYVTPTGKLEYLLGKQLPYIGIGMINFFILAIMTLVIFDVPIKGSFLMLTLCAVLYVMATTGLGMVTSSFTRTQNAAIIVTAVLTVVPTVSFSGMLQPVSTLQGFAKFIGSIWPAAYYNQASLGAYTKGVSPLLMMRYVAVLACCFPILLAASFVGLRKQEK